MGRYQRFSLFYVASYLLGGGIALLVVPHLALRLFFANDPDAYGDLLPRMAGALTIALGVFVVQTIRHELRVLYTTLVALRVFLVSVWLGLYAVSRDPFFFTLAMVVAFGVVLSTIAIALDRRAAPQI